MNHDDPLDRLASTLVPRIAASLGQPGRLLNASEVAERCGVTRGWVYDHAGELGALRLGGGPRPRLRFDSALVDEALRAGVGGQLSRRRARRAKTSQTGVELLPIGPPTRVGSSHGNRQR